MTEEPTESPPERERKRDEVRSRIETLKVEQRQLEERRQATTEEIHRLLREAHDLGWTWAEIADFAGYRNAAVARNQASPESPPPEPRAAEDGSYSVRDAAARLGVTPTTVYAWIKSGRLQTVETSARGQRVVVPESLL